MPARKRSSLTKTSKNARRMRLARSQESTEERESRLNRMRDGTAEARARYMLLIKQFSAESENEIKVFCPKCDTEVSHTAEGIQEQKENVINPPQKTLPRKQTADMANVSVHKEIQNKIKPDFSASNMTETSLIDQTKILIAKVYHYFEEEYEELKKIYGELDLTPLSKFRQRTALATGVSETTVIQILKEEEERNAVKQEEPPKKRRRAGKRFILTESSSDEDRSDDNTDANEQSSTVHDAQTLVVKVETSDNEEPEIYFPALMKAELSDIEVNKEQAQIDPISLDVKIEPSPQSDVLDNTNETLALTEPAGTKRRGRKIPRIDDKSTMQHTQGESSTAAAWSSDRLMEELDEQHTQGESSTAAAWSCNRLMDESDEDSLYGDTEIKIEEIEIHEEEPR